MSSPDYDNPEVEEKWCDKCRVDVADYLKQEGVTHGRIGDWPAWHIAPYVSIWAVESAKRPEWIGWWVICGELPTDYVSADSIKHPRDAVRAIAGRWREVSNYMNRGEKHPTMNIGAPDTWPELGPLLLSRAQLLVKWVEDDSVWEE